MIVVYIEMVFVIFATVGVYLLLSRRKKISNNELWGHSFVRYIISPLVKRIVPISLMFTNPKQMEQLTHKLVLADATDLDVANFLAIRFATFATFAFFGMMLPAILYITGNNWSIQVILIMVLLLSVIGYFSPHLWLQAKANMRQIEVRKAMPDMIGLLYVYMEVGLSFDLAVSKVGQEWDNELSAMFRVYSREVNLGKTSQVALHEMSNRIDLPEFTGFVAAVTQSSQLGVNLAKSLKIQSNKIDTEWEEKKFRELAKIDYWNKLIIYTLFGPVFILWFTWPILAQILSALSR